MHEQNKQFVANIKDNPLDKIAIQAAFLGTIFGASLTIILIYRCTLDTQIPYYFLLLSVFHFLEFYTTAKYNAPQVTADSFIINHSGAYTAAHIAAIAEATLQYLFYPQLQKFKIFKILRILGLALVVGGQYLRSAAMKTAGQSFSHIIKTEHFESLHKLITRGVYSFFRHPSYTGYYYWALGSQLLLGNLICFFGFSITLYRFFRKRIQYEENLLVIFFGDDYEKYKKTTGIYIPFL